MSHDPIPPPAPPPPETDLPEGWASATMGDISQVVGGGTPKSTDQGNFAESGHPWITPADLSNFSGIFIANGRRDLTDKGLAACSARLLPAGTVLMSSRAPIGYVAIAAHELCTNQGFKSFILANGFDSKFVLYWLRFKRDEIEQMGSGSTFTEISGSRCKEIPIIFPCLSEQRRIVAKVEELLGRVNAARARLAKVPSILKRFRQSILAAACSGQLTAKWRESQEEHLSAKELVLSLVDRRARSGFRSGRSGAIPEAAFSEFNDLPESWAILTVDSILAEPLCNGISPPGTESPPGVASLKLNAMTDRGFDYSAIRYIQINDELSADLSICEGDFFVSRGNGSLSLVGRGTIAQKPPRHTVYPDTMIRVRLVPEIAETRWLPAIWASRLIREQIEAKAKTTAGIWKISQGDLASISIPCPPLKEQKEIVRRIEDLFALADRIEASVQAAMARAERLPQAILARAFRGELVPTEADLAAREGRGYEPAAALLARIEEARQQQSSSKLKPGGKRMPKEFSRRPAAKNRRPLDEVLQEQGKPVTPERLFDLAGFNEGSVDLFYEQLRQLVRDGKIRETRPSQKEVYLEAVEI